jgi:hypothetical protein
MEFEAVPATAGHVIVAVPLVEPAPEMTHPVVPAMPQLIAVLNKLDQYSDELPSAIEFVVPGSSAALMATADRLFSATVAPLPVPHVAHAGTPLVFSVKQFVPEVFPAKIDQVVHPAENAEQ